MKRIAKTQKRQFKHVEKTLRRKIGAQLYECRIQQQLSLGQLSRKSGLSVRTLDFYESGRGNFQLHILGYIAHALGKSLDSFIQVGT